MNLFVTFTLAEADTGPFNLFSNVDGYTSAIAAYVPKQSLLDGFTIMNAPNGTTIVRAYSTGNCLNSIDIPITPIITTTTTSTSTTLTTTTTINVTCSEIIISGGAGIDETLIPLSPNGGIILFEFGIYRNPDKLEIIHNGVKKSTTGTTVPNSGPFDNVYGTFPSNVIPTVSEGVLIDQFISTDKPIPERETDFYTDTGYLVQLDPNYLQLIWWEYTPADYLINDNVSIKVTGCSNSTTWVAKRMCNFSLP